MSPTPGRVRRGRASAETMASTDHLGGGGGGGRLRRDEASAAKPADGETPGPAPEIINFINSFLSKQKRI